jgi:hypothetical protein
MQPDLDNGSRYAIRCKNSIELPGMKISEPLDIFIGVVYPTIAGQKCSEAAYRKAEPNKRFE